MADIYVNSEELKLIASGMKNKATIIMDAYQNDIVTALTMSSEALQISGLDTTTVLNSFNKIFTNINTRINTLADFLLTTVTNEYDEVSSAITNEFDNNFANEIAGILGITVGAGSSTTPSTGGGSTSTGGGNTSTGGSTSTGGGNTSSGGSSTGTITKPNQGTSGSQNNNKYPGPHHGKPEVIDEGKGSIYPGPLHDKPQATIDTVKTSYKPSSSGTTNTNTTTTVSKPSTSTSTTTTTPKPSTSTTTTTRPSTSNKTNNSTITHGRIDMIN